MKKSPTSKKQKKALLTTAVLFCLIGSSVALAGEPTTICRIGKTVRTIRVEKIAGGCKTIYTKEGVDSQAGIAQSQQSCVDFASNIEKNLANAGWKCRTFEEAQVSDLGGAANSNNSTN